MRAVGSQKRRDGVESIPVLVVGAGPAGLAASSRLAAAGCRHLVLERATVGWSWQAQRWASFRLNTPTWGNRIPGHHLGGAPDSFATAGAFVDALRRFAADLPVLERVEVSRARSLGHGWRVETSLGTLVARAVVVASGFQNVPRTPDYADLLPSDVAQLHVADYRRPEDVEGGVLVVGGGQSGLQIAEDLLDAGKRVHLSTSAVARLPRRHRGRDAYEWMHETGQLELAREQADAATIRATPPQVSGAAGGRTVSYQALAARGATLLGRAVGLDGRRLVLAPDLAWNVMFADQASQALRARWDKHATRRLGWQRPPADVDSADLPARHLYSARGPASLDLAAARIRTVIWATGFDASVGWLPAGALDERHRPRLPGLHVIGAPWLTHRSSGNLYGMATDAERLAGVLASERGRLAA